MYSQAEVFNGFDESDLLATLTDLKNQKSKLLINENFTTFNNEEKAKCKLKKGRQLGTGTKKCEQSQGYGDNDF